MSVEDQVRQIERVKRAESYIVDKPITLTISHTVGAMKKIVEDTYTGGILILDGDEHLVGIVTTRDLLFEQDDSKKLSEIMTRKVISAPRDTTLEQAEKILHEHRIEKLPLVDFERQTHRVDHDEGYLETNRVSQSSERRKGSVERRCGRGCEINRGQARRTPA